MRDEKASWSARTQNPKAVAPQPSTGSNPPPPPRESAVAQVQWIILPWHRQLECPPPCVLLRPPPGWALAALGTAGALGKALVPLAVA
ncbi:hypothetical protein VULLAG_LOCUS19909 [Vulpes lagopus]